MAQLIIAAAGAAALGPLGLGLVSAGTGFAIGGLVYSAFNQQKLSAPRLSDTKAPQVAYGSPIMRVYGHPRHGGNIAWQSGWREIVSSEGGKGGLGGPEVETVTYVCDLLIVFSTNMAGSLRRVWQNGKLIWSNADESTQGSVNASEEAPWSRITFYEGAADQEPDPTYEAAVGSDNAPGYRDRTSIFIQDYQGGAAAQVQVLTFECGGVGEGSGSGEDFMYMPYATDPVDVIAPAATFVYTLSPDGYDVTFNGDFASFGQTVANPGGDSQGVNHTVTKASPFLFDYSEPTQYEVSIRGVQVYVASPGFASAISLVRFRRIATALNSVDIGAYFIDSNTSQLVISKSDGSGGTVSTFHSVYFLNNSAEKFTFRLEVPANPANPAAVNPTDPTLIYVSSDDPASPYFEEVQIDAHFSGAFDRIDVGAGDRVTTGNTFSGIQAFGIKDLRGYRGDARRSGGIPLSEPTLQTVVEGEHLVAGDDLAFVDATALAPVFVKALPVTQVVSPRQVIESCMAAYFFTAVSSGTGVRYSFLGSAPVATIPYEDLGATAGDVDGERLPIAIANDTEIPAQVFVKYINVNDDYQDGTESSDRLISNSINTLTVDLPIGLTPEEAKRVADITVMRGAVESMRFGPFSLNRDYSALEPTDVVLIYDRYGNLHRVRLTKKTEAQGVLTFEGVRDDATIFNSAALTSGGYTNSTLVQPKVDTQGYLLDIGLLRTSDDASGIYAGLLPLSAPYPGARILSSPDDVTYTELVTSTARRVVAGEAVTALADWAGGEVWDKISTVRVTALGGTLASYTEAQVLEDRLGSYLLGNEIFHARTATLVATNTYDLSNLIRGRNGTEWAMGLHEIGERFVALDPATLLRIPLDITEVGVEKFYKTVTLGRNLSTATAQEFTFAAVSQKPLAPVDLRRTELGFSWQRRTRHDTNFTGPTGSIVPLAEESESYDVELYNGAILVESDTVSGPQWLRSGLVNLGQIGAPCYGLRLIGSTFYGIRADGGFGLYPRQIVTFNSDGGEIETLATGATTSTISVGDTVLQFESTATNLYFASYSQPPLGAITAQIHRVAVADINTIAATLPNANATYFPGIAHDGTNLWACENPDKLYRLNSSTLAVVNTYTISNALFYGQMKFSAGNLYIVNSFDHTIVVVNPATGVESSRFSVVPNPGGLYIVGTVAFVTSLTSAQLGVYNLTTGAQLQLHDVQASSNLPDLAFGLFGGEVAVCSVDLNIYFFNATTGALVRKSRVPGQKYVNSIALATAGGLYLTGEPTPPITNTSRQTYKFEVGDEDLTGYTLTVYQNSATVGRGYPAEKTL